MNITFGLPAEKANNNASSTPLALHLRIPYWAPNATVVVNGEVWESCNGTVASISPRNGTFCVVQRTFQPGRVPSFILCKNCNIYGGHPLQHEHAMCLILQAGEKGPLTLYERGLLRVGACACTGDTIEMWLPMGVYLEQIQDNRVEFADFQVTLFLSHAPPPKGQLLLLLTWSQSMQAIIMGGFVMAGITHNARNITMPAAEVASRLSVPPHHAQYISMFSLDAAGRARCAIRALLIYASIVACPYNFRR